MDNLHSINHLLWEIIKLQFARNHEIFEKYGLHPGQPPLLLSLHNEDGQSQSSLAHNLRVKPSTVTMMIRRLERGELIFRKWDEHDKRVCRIFLTPKGYSICNELKLVNKSTEALYLKNLSVEEQIIFKRLLMQVRDNLSDAQTSSTHSNLKGDES